MNVTYRIDKDILYIAVEGRIDASNASMAEEKIFEIKKYNEGNHIVIDADNLEYISSAGLRIILKLRKEEPKLAIINVSPEVYEIFPKRHCPLPYNHGIWHEYWKAYHQATS